MAAVPVTIVGLATSDDGETKNVTIVGMASITGLQVGGGPMPGGPGKPPGIWGGGNVPMPTPPIANVPGAPGYNPNPPSVWPNPPEGIAPHPEHPIVIPPSEPPSGGTPDDDGFLKPPPPNGGWAFHQDYHWGYYPKPGEAGPKG